MMLSRHTRRREFITLLGGTAAAWPVAAHAQQPERVRRIGVLMPLATDDPVTRTRFTTFKQALQGLGWTDGRNVHIDSRFSAGNAADTRKYAAELAALAPDVILVVGSAGLPPLLQATQTVPIVFALVPDPVGSGFVESLSRPGGNATGFMMFEYNLCGKWLELAAIRLDRGLPPPSCEGLAKRKGVVARRCLKEAWSKAAALGLVIRFLSIAR
jgi:putative tryptophan/tyrosine transport system substrate-binding protein